MGKLIVTKIIIFVAWALSPLFVITRIVLQAQTLESPRKAYLGFDRNEYPGDAAISALKQHFDFVGYWLTNPPGEHTNTWVGKRSALRDQGFGFLVLANGKTDAEIKAAGLDSTALGKRDGVSAVAAAKREGFPATTLLFLDQEEGGRMLPEQADYLFAWTETVSAAGFRAGVYGSGQRVDEGRGQSITTAADIAAQSASRHSHPVAMWVYQDACPPSSGCTLRPPALEASGTINAEIWQYAQSPRRRENTASCSRTYSADGNCYVKETSLAGIQLDLNVAASPDPSHGR